MGTIKHRDKVMEFFRKTPIVTIDSLKKIVGGRSNYINLMLHNLLKQGKIYRITRGAYSLHDDPVVAVFCFKPGYLGLQEALSIHNLWEQETNPVILTVKTVREGTRKVRGSTVILRRIPAALFFGVEYVPYGGAHVPVSDVEKTLLDMVYFKQPLDWEVRRELRKRIRRAVLKEYLRRYDVKTQQEVRALLKI